MSQKIKIGVIITDGQDRILLLKEKIKKNSVPLWNIVTGSYGDSGQETLIEAAMRECREEAGLEIKITDLSGCYISQTDEEVRAQFNFLARVKSGIPHLAPEDEQASRDECITELKWFTKEEVKKMKREEFISNRTYMIILDWLRGNKYPLETIKHIEI